MIVLSILITVISLLLQGIMSNYLGYTYNFISIFSTNYILIALLILIPHFENKKKYFYLLIIFGLIVDIVYTNTFIFNTSLFVVCYYISKLFHSFFPYNWLTTSISNLLCIMCYHIISFLFLQVLNYDLYNVSYLTTILSRSILMTVLYSNIVYFTITLTKSKFQLKDIK